MAVVIHKLRQKKPSVNVPVDEITKKLSSYFNFLVISSQRLTESFFVNANRWVHLHFHIG